MAPISAPNTGPDPRTSYGLDMPAPDARPAVHTGPDPGNSQPADQTHQMPAPGGPTDVRDRNPAPGTNPDPGFNSNGIQANSGATVRVSNSMIVSNLGSGLLNDGSSFIVSLSGNTVAGNPTPGWFTSTILKQ